jgi:hypothetical protein
MTKRMEPGIDRLQKLAPEDQHRIAERVLHHLADDTAWTATTTKHAAALKPLIEQIIAEDGAGDGNAG